MKIISALFVVFLSLGFALHTSAQTDPFPPAPSFSGLLSTVHIKKSGEYKPLKTLAYFMSADKGVLKVSKDGSEIAAFKFRVDPSVAPKFTLDGFEIVSGKNDIFGLVLKEPGKYELGYYAKGAKFYSFPFELEINSGNDPYKPQKLMRLNGPWNKYAYLYRTSTESHGKWEFRIFIRSEDGSLQQSKGQVLVTRDRDKKLVAVGFSPFRREAGWTRQELVLEKPGIKNPQGEYYNNTDFLANSDKFEDGSYTANFNMDGKPYGTYKFTVKGGNIQPQGQQIRESTDPTIFIEGGGQEFWLPKN